MHASCSQSSERGFQVINPYCMVLLVGNCQIQDIYGYIIQIPDLLYITRPPADTTARAGMLLQVDAKARTVYVVPTQLGWEQDGTL